MGFLKFGSHIHLSLDKFDNQKKSSNFALPFLGSVFFQKFGFWGIKD